MTTHETQVEKTELEKKNHQNKPTWKVLSQSVVGTSHQQQKLPCQDAHFWQIWLGEVLVASVADGAGSAPLSQVGANIAVQKAVEAVCQNNALLSSRDREAWKMLLHEALEAALTSVKTEASKREVPLRDLASTLIIVVATPQMIVTAQIGDGAVVVADKKGQIITLTTPQTGEFINQTVFLNSPNALSAAKIDIWTGEAANLAIFSDGLQMLALKMPEGTPHIPFFTPLFKFVSHMTDEAVAKEQLTSFLSSPRVSQKTDDDLTILLVSFGD